MAEVTQNFNTSQIGCTVFGQGQFLSVSQIQSSNTISQNRNSSLLRSQLGWGFHSELMWTRAYPYRIRPRRVSGGVGTSITVTSVSGALVGQIRTDIQKSLVQSLEITVDENGSADFILKLNALPEFEILPMSIITVNIGDSEFNWFRGVVTYPDTQGAYRDSYEFRGFGMRRWLEQLRADTDYGAGLDISEIILDIAENWIAPYAPIAFNPARIAPNTGVIVGTTIELGKFSLRQVLDTLADMAVTEEYRYVWGVDGDGEFYFSRIANNSFEKSMFVGYNLNDFEPKINYEEVKNVITLQRQEGRGAGGAGWSVAGVYNDESSVKKYGRNELNYQIPGFFAQPEADIIGEALIQDLSEPKESAKARNWQAKSQLDFLHPGNYRIILPLGNYTELASDIDNADEFTVFGSGDLTVSDDDTYFIFADGGVRFNFQNADQQRAELDIEVDGLIQEVRLYIRGNAIGQYLTVGVGETVWDEVTAPLDVAIQNTFVPFRWDLRSQNIRNLRKFAIRVDGDQPTPRAIWIDKLEVLLRGHKTYTMRFKRAVYRYSPDSSGAEIEFGTLPNRLTDYIAGLQATASELKFTGEIR